MHFRFTSNNIILSAIELAILDSIMSTSWDTCTSDLTAAILDFRLPFTSSNIGTSSTELLDLENVGVAVEIRCYHEYGLRYTLFHIYFRLMATIFDYRHTQTVYSFSTSLSVLPKNMGIAVRFSLLSCVEA